MQKYMFKFCSFAFRNDKALTEAIDKIKAGRSNEDMILDLLSLHLLCKDNKAILEQMKMFDTSKIDEAKDLHNKLSEIHARSNIDPKKVDEAKNILNHAYTYYKQAADLVKEHGQFVFEGTDRYQEYVSDYHRNLGKMSDKVKPSTSI